MTREVQDPKENAHDQFAVLALRNTPLAALRGLRRSLNLSSFFYYHIVSGSLPGGGGILLGLGSRKKDGITATRARASRSQHRPVG